MKNILIIDDDPAIRLLIRTMLKHSDYSITEASDGAEGILRIRETPVDIVISDLYMPNKEGLETIKEIKNKHPNIRIIAMSGGGAIHLGTAQLLGADVVFSKPFTKEDLLTAIQNLT